MNPPSRPDPHRFVGCFAYLASDIPPGVTLSAWRSQRPAKNPRRAHSPHGPSGADQGAPDPAAQARTLPTAAWSGGPDAGRGSSPRSDR